MLFAVSQPTPSEITAPDAASLATLKERMRLDTLASYHLLDTPPEAIFDEITALASQLCDVPFALINLVGTGRKWIKSIHGELSVKELSHRVGFCRHVVDHAEPLEIADAAHDVRFFNDPLVTGGPKLRFYAGVPLLAPNGHALGTLCVLDHRPRALTDHQRAALHQLADVVIRLFDARRHEENATWIGGILDDSLNEILVFDVETHRVVHANVGACRNLGYSPEEMVALTATDIATDWSDRDRRQVNQPLLDGEREHVVFETTVRRKNGATYPVEVRAQLSKYRGRRVFVVIANDISARKLAEEQLYREKEFAQITLASIGDALITTDATGRVTYMNPVAERLTGWLSVEAAGRVLEEVFHIVSEHDRLRVDSPVDRVLQQGENSGLANNTMLIARDGREYSVEDSAAPIRDRDGKLAGVVLVFRDVTEARELANNLSWQASHDTLTELVNRREFENLLTGLLASARTRNIEHALLYLDLDQFKVVNDSCGHQAGDELLKQLSALLKSKMRRSDTLARLGGDEFGVLLEGCDTARAQQIAQQLLETIRAFRFVWQDRLFSVSASIGVAEICAASESVEALLSAADTACFMAKDKGRSQVQVFRMADEEVSSRHGEVGWASRLARSVEDNRFFLVFQGAQKLQPGGDDLNYVEVLLRLKDEQGRVVPPMAFIPAAERYQLMSKVDRWVLKRVMHCMAHYARSAGREAALCRRTRFAVNLSGVSLSDAGFLDFVLAEFDATGANPAQICFEITETAAISNVARVTRFMAQLKARGCRFALDDFGSGLSSFAYLKNMPVDYLKIDGMFVKGAATDSTDFSMVESINRIGHVMGMKTIAEFVENQTILEQMRALGVDYAQGHHLHQPELFSHWVARCGTGQSGPLEVACA